MNLKLRLGKLEQRALLRHQLPALHPRTAALQGIAAKPLQQILMSLDFHLAMMITGELQKENPRDYGRLRNLSDAIYSMALRAHYDLYRGPLVMPAVVWPVYANDKFAQPLHQCTRCYFEVPVRPARRVLIGENWVDESELTYFPRCPVCGGRTTGIVKASSLDRRYCPK